MIQNSMGFAALVAVLSLTTSAVAAPSLPIHEGNVWVFDSSVEGDSLTISMSDYSVDDWGYEAVTLIVPVGALGPVALIGVPAAKLYRPEKSLTIQPTQIIAV